MGTKRAFHLLLFGVLCFAAVGLASEQRTSPPQQGKGILDVLVLDENAQRMVGATVAVPGYRSTTGLSGSCRFGLLAGRYSVLVNKAGYRGRRVTAGVRPGETTRIEVKMQKLQPARPPRK